MPDQFYLQSVGLHRRPTARKRGWLPACLFLLLIPPSLSHAGWIEDTPTGTIIHVSCFDLPDPARSDTSTRADLAVVREFVRRYPSIFAARYRTRYFSHPEKYGRHKWKHVSVSLHRASGIRVEGVESTLLAIAGKVAPDVIYVNFRMSDTFIQQRFLYPLDLPDDHYLESMTPEELSFRVHPKIWPVIRRPGPDGTSHVWALPYGGALGKVVLYRRDLFDEFKVPYPTNDWTWNDMLTACRKITHPNRGIYGIYFSRGKHESWWWMSFLWSAGGRAVVYDHTNHHWKAVFDSPQAALALDFYNRLCTEPWTDERGRRHRGYAYRDPDWGTAGAKWARGEIGMMFAYIDQKIFQKINPDVTGMVPVPRGPTGLRGAELNSMMMGLFAGIREPAVRDAAWEYMRFYDSMEAMRIRTRIMVEGGLGRFMNPTYLKMFGYPELARLTPKGWQECFKIAISTGKPEPYGKNCNYAYNIISEPIQQAEQLAFDDRLPRNQQARLRILRQLLHQAAIKANEEMLGLVSPATRTKRNRTAAIALGAAVLLFIIGISKLGSAFLRPSHTKAVTPRRRLSSAKVILLLLPAVVSIVLWQYLPLIRGSLMSFQDYRLMGDSSWVGLNNFGEVLWDREWWHSVWNSVRYSTLIIILGFLPPLILAIFLQEIPRGKIFFRSLYYLPSIATGLVAVLLWKSFFDPSESGALNAILLHVPAVAFILTGFLIFGTGLYSAFRLWHHEKHSTALLAFIFGMLSLAACFSITRPMLSRSDLPLLQRLLLHLPEPLRWLGDAHLAILACAMPVVWASLGPACLIYLAALKSIPDDLYDAAELDGAGFADKILFIVFPALRPLLIINFVGMYTAAWLYATANILAMTGGAADTEVAGLHIFYKAFIYLRFGPATAMAWVLGFILIGFTAYQLRILARVEFRTAKQ